MSKVEVVRVCMLTLEQFVEGQEVYQVNCPSRHFFMSDALKERLNSDAAKTKIGQDLMCPRCN